MSGLSLGMKTLSSQHVVSSFQIRIEPGLSALEACSLSHWTTRKALELNS